MDRYKDRFNDNFAHNRVEVGSRNQINVRDLAASPAFTILVGFAILLIVAVTIFLAIVALWLLEILIYAAIGMVCIWTLWIALNRLIRTGAKTYAVVTYYLGQRKRNKVLHDGPGLVVLEDPYEQLRTVHARTVQVQRRYDNSSSADMSALPARSGEQKDIDFENIIKWHGGSQPHEAEEEEEGASYEVDEG
jgi:hypothetical protein